VQNPIGQGSPSFIRLEMSADPQRHALLVSRGVLGAAKPITIAPFEISGVQPVLRFAVRLISCRWYQAFG
jgi:hypothetical protein